MIHYEVDVTIGDAPTTRLLVPANEGATDDALATATSIALQGVGGEATTITATIAGVSDVPVPEPEPGAEVEAAVDGTAADI